MTPVETMWSPEAIVGYRVWSVRHDRLEGSRRVWRSPSATAACDNTADPPPSPHTGARCACGIYAAKEVHRLRREFPGIGHRGVAVGKVHLSGRVIEHTHGYRAQHAEVVEIVVGTDSGLVHLTAPDDIAALFEGPARVVAAAPRSTGSTPEAVLAPGGIEWT